MDYTWNRKWLVKLCVISSVLTCFLIALAHKPGDREDGTAGAVGEETCPVWAVHGTAAF